MRSSPAVAAVGSSGAAVAILSDCRRFRLFSSAGGYARGSGKLLLSSFRCSAAEGPSCIFVGPIDNASQETLEALYQQARDSYYSGKPLIIDDMFDKVELKLRLYGSKSVVKYPRCSLKKQSVYADAEEDPSQAMALASIWILLFAFGTVVFLLPALYAMDLSSSGVFRSSLLLENVKSPVQWLSTANSCLSVGLGLLIGLPISSASAKALRGLLTNDLVALKGCCPSCGEEVFAFVKSVVSDQRPHRTECHVCGSVLEFRTKMEKSPVSPWRRWVYGRVYLVSRSGSGRRRWG